jgi:U3 small nucleolar RNA-associated protein 23
MRHLYACAKDPGVSALIDRAKMYERVRCGHKPEEYPEPLSTTDCFSAVVDRKGTHVNKHCYVVASQEIKVRKAMRSILGVPLVYIERSVMKMEPMTDDSQRYRSSKERAKLREGLRDDKSLKRKRNEEDEEAEEVEKALKKKKKTYGPKEPNPLSMKKPKKKPAIDTPKKDKLQPPTVTDDSIKTDGEVPAKKKRKRTHSKKKKPAEEGAEEEIVPEAKETQAS